MRDARVHASGQVSRVATAEHRPPVCGSNDRSPIVDKGGSQRSSPSFREDAYASVEYDEDSKVILALRVREGRFRESGPISSKAAAYQRQF